MSIDTGSADLFYSLAAFIETPEAKHDRWAAALDLPAPESLVAWQAQYAQTFIECCYPYASIYIGEQGAIGGEAADRVAGFRRLLGASIDDPPDGLAVLLGDYASLVAHSGNDIRARHARRALLWEHLLCWLMPYLDSLVRAAPAPYRAWAHLAKALFRIEAMDSAPPEQLPLHLRAAPAVAGLTEMDTIDDIACALLVPVRSGLVWSRADLAGMASDIGAAVGLGSRRFILRHLLEGQPRTALRWLAEAAHAQASARAGEIELLGGVAEFWRGRAFDTANALDAMAIQVGRGADMPRDVQSA